MSKRVALVFARSLMARDEERERARKHKCIYTYMCVYVESYREECVYSVLDLCSDAY